MTDARLTQATHGARRPRGPRYKLTDARVVEERHGFPGALRAWGVWGAMSGPPTSTDPTRAWLRPPTAHGGLADPATKERGPTRCAALALNTAVIVTPSARPRSATERAVTVATSGKPTSTTTRVPGVEGTTRAIVPPSWLRALDSGIVSVGSISVTSSGRIPSRTSSPGRAAAAISRFRPATSTTVRPAARERTRPVTSVSTPTKRATSSDT